MGGEFSPRSPPRCAGDRGWASEGRRVMGSRSRGRSLGRARGCTRSGCARIGVIVEENHGTRCQRPVFATIFIVSDLVPVVTSRWWCIPAGLVIPLLLVFRRESLARDLITGAGGCFFNTAQGVTSEPLFCSASRVRESPRRRRRVKRRRSSSRPDRNRSSRFSLLQCETRRI